MTKRWRSRKQAQYSEDEIAEKRKQVVAKYGDLIRRVIIQAESSTEKGEGKE